MHQGQPVLLDANPTPGRPKSVRSMLVAAAANLADGFEGMIGRGVRESQSLASDATPSQAPHTSSPGSLN